jgi:aryl-alcohol dehydrogenase-like predicted oxidoreductase
MSDARQQPALPTRQLGRGGPDVSALGLGCMGMSHGYGARDDAESLATLHLALDLGVTFFDTADIYGHGRNETLVGGALAPRRRDVLIATKFGFVPDEGTPYGTISGRPDYVRRACDASLQRLCTDVIDLYYMHRRDPDVPVEETVGTMGRLVEDGKVRFLGLCEVSAETLYRAHAAHPIAALQSEYSLWTRDAEEEVLPACRELGIGFVPFSPLGRGFLTASLARQDFDTRDMRSRLPRFSAENRDRNEKLLDPLKALADDRGCTPAQIALAWVLSRGDDIVPIPGTKRRRYLEENVAAASIELSEEDVARLEEAFPPGIAAGPRYDEAGMASVGG